MNSGANMYYLTVGSNNHPVTSSKMKINLKNEIEVADNWSRFMISKSMGIIIFLLFKMLLLQSINVYIIVLM